MYKKKKQKRKKNNPPHAHCAPWCLCTWPGKWLCLSRALLSRKRWKKGVKRCTKKVTKRERERTIAWKYTAEEKKTRKKQKKVKTRNEQNTKYHAKSKNQPKMPKVCVCLCVNVLKYLWQKDTKRNKSQLSSIVHAVSRRSKLKSFQNDFLLPSDAQQKNGFHCWHAWWWSAVLCQELLTVNRF